MANLDDIDRKIIAILRDDARAPIASMAAALGVTRATIKARIAKMEAAGTITGYAVRLGAPGEGAGVRAIAMIEVEGRGTDRVARHMAGLPQVRSLHSTNGKWDMVAEIETDTLAEFDDVLRAIRLIDGISLTETSILLAPRLQR
ncbi:Lrp/AsnC family transcriptional regulator [Pelagibacterium lacus]|uniref:Lrp/AsnC family transcriptional regulator n=1 Tax=Pelagibacterium lacus TaxID=2282655 RepID=A0A369WB51_9HYPH|nr:Lrp/AsnC family transcriptional regulator [Pelagibacterium lacus]RDE09311.1 Lrp/AsnC family transcriptional regulator [Pelagibacterium lacus]